MNEQSVGAHSSQPRVEVRGGQVVLYYGAEEIALADNEAWDLGDELCLAAERIWAKKATDKVTREANDAVEG